MRFREDDPIFQAVEIGGHLFPGIWKYMLPEDFAWFRLPRERLCTCDDCYEVARNNYHPACRCCNHFPQLPNFSIGLGLLNPSSREMMKSIIDGAQGLPEGLRPSPEQYARSVVAYSKDLFGKSEELNCFLLNPESQQCLLYELRGAICATFFCQNDHGPLGHEFWTAVLDLVVQLELALELWCIEQMGISTPRYISRFERLADNIAGASDDGTGGWAEDAYRQIWGDYYGREAEFYVSCAKLAMENRENLFEIACRQQLLRPLAYERQERLAIDKEHRHEALAIPGDDYKAISIDELWYKLQVIYRRLTAIPFNEEAYRLADDVHLEPKTDSHSALPVHDDKSHVAWRRDENGERDELYLTPQEQAALVRLEEPWVFGEKLFQTPEFAALEEPRDFLAICLRRGYLSVA